jgi:MerR family transcriptional regulator, heat shock protein HspR
LLELAVPSLPIDDENLPLFTVGQVSIMLEVQQAFLRRLDEKGVVSPSRSEGRQRRYTRREVTVVQYVVQLAEQGVSLAGIRRILELEALVGALEAQIGELEQECRALRARLLQQWQEAQGEPPGWRDRRDRAGVAETGGTGPGRERGDREPDRDVP